MSASWPTISVAISAMSARSMGPTTRCCGCAEARARTFCRSHGIIRAHRPARGGEPRSNASLFRGRLAKASFASTPRTASSSLPPRAWRSRALPHSAPRVRLSAVWCSIRLRVSGIRAANSSSGFRGMQSVWPSWWSFRSRETKSLVRTGACACWCEAFRSSTRRASITRSRRESSRASSRRAARRSPLSSSGRPKRNAAPCTTRAPCTPNRSRTPAIPWSLSRSWVACASMRLPASGITRKRLPHRTNSSRRVRWCRTRAHWRSCRCGATNGSSGRSCSARRRPARCDRAT